MLTIPAFQAMPCVDPDPISFEEYKAVPQSVVVHDDNGDFVTTQIVAQPLKDIPSVPYTTFGVDEITRAGGLNQLKFVPAFSVDRLHVLDTCDLEQLASLADAYEAAMKPAPDPESASDPAPDPAS